MRKMKNVVLAFSALALLFVTSCQKKDVVLENAQIPESINSYVRTNFHNQSILNCLQDKKSNGYEYNVALSGDVLLLFNESYEIQRIDGKTELPETVVPLKIRDYVDANYPGQSVTDWELAKKSMQEVTLTNDVRLQFEQSGKFVTVL